MIFLSRSNELFIDDMQTLDNEAISSRPYGCHGSAWAVLYVCIRESVCRQISYANMYSSSESDLCMYIHFWENIWVSSMLQ